MIKFDWFKKRSKNKEFTIEESKIMLLDAIKKTEFYDKMVDGVNALLWDIPKLGVQIILIEKVKGEVLSVIGTDAIDVYAFLDAHKLEFLKENNDNPKVFSPNKPFNISIV